MPVNLPTMTISMMLQHCSVPLELRTVACDYPATGMSIIEEFGNPRKFGKQQCVVRRKSEGHQMDEDKQMLKIYSVSYLKSQAVFSAVDSTKLQRAQVRNANSDGSVRRTY